MRALDAQDIASRLDYERLLPAVAAAFEAYVRGLLPAAGKVDTFVPGGEFHIKTGGASGVFTVKANSGFFGKASGPAIQGCVAVFDLADGAPLALLESTVLTRRRTAAVTAVAVAAVADGSPRRVALLGAGAQAIEHASALAHRFALDELVIWSRHPARAELATSAVRRATGVACRQADTAGGAVRGADVAITLTPSREPVLRASDVTDVPLVIGVGADSPGKQELDPRILTGRHVVTDLTEQCLRAGELQHADGARVYAELGQLLTGVSRPVGPAVVDLTGAGFADAAAAAVVLDRV